ncbi:hypothetical protein KIF59_16680 [Enterobacter cloacae subsp. cloacae]|nr:hypothetical protein [Enterobacter cloacae subsp. cloacae]
MRIPAAQYDWERSGTDATLSLDNGLNVAPRLRYQTPSGVKREDSTVSYAMRCRSGAASAATFA